MNHPIKKILLYIDGSEASITAAQMAIAMAKAHGTVLKVVYVVNESLLGELLKAKIFVEVEKMDYERDLEEDGKRYLNFVVKLAGSKSVNIETVLRKGIVHEEVAREVEEFGADLLIQGELGEVLSLRDSHYEEGERILRRVKCSVMVARNAEKIEKVFKQL